MLIGEAGVGKTAIVEGLAQRIVDGDVPETLHGKRVVELDLAGLVAGTRYRGDFEERLTKIIDEIRAHSDELIVFIDELHTVVGAGRRRGRHGRGQHAQARPGPRRAAHRRRDDARRVPPDIEKDAALERRFQPILVPEPSVEDAVEILRGLRDRYEAHHQVRFTDEALVAAAELSDRYITDRFLPDKAIDLIDQAGARVRLRPRRPADLRGSSSALTGCTGRRTRRSPPSTTSGRPSLRDQIAELTDRIDRAAGGDAVEAGRRARGRPADIAEMVSRATGIPVASSPRRRGSGCSSSSGACTSGSSARTTR